MFFLNCQRKIQKIRLTCINLCLGLTKATLLLQIECKQILFENTRRRAAVLFYIHFYFLKVKAKSVLLHTETDGYFTEIDADFIFFPFFCKNFHTKKCGVSGKMCIFAPLNMKKDKNHGRKEIQKQKGAGRLLR